MGGRASRHTKTMKSKMKKSSKRRLFTEVKISELTVNPDQPINNCMSACYICAIYFSYKYILQYFRQATTPKTLIVIIQKDFKSNWS